MAIQFYIAAQTAAAGVPQPVQRGEAIMNVVFEFDTLPPVHEVTYACETIFSSLRALHSDDTGPADGAFLVESILFFDEYRLCWCELMSAVQLHPGVQLFCISPTQCSALPRALRKASVELLEATGKQLLPSPDPQRVVRWPWTSGRETSGAAQHARGRLKSELQAPPATAEGYTADPATCFDKDSQGRAFSARVRDVFTALDRESRTFLLLRDVFDFAARYTLSPSALRSLKTSAPVGASSVFPSLSPLLEENLARLAARAPLRTEGSSEDPSFASGVVPDGSGSQLEAIVRAADTDGDGRISFSEWADYCLTHPQVLALFHLHLHPPRPSTPLSPSTSSASREGHRRCRTPTSVWTAVAAPASSASASRRSSSHRTLHSAPQTVVEATPSAVDTETGDVHEARPATPARGDGTDSQRHTAAAKDAAAVAAQPVVTPRFMTSGHHSHRCHFRKCSACDAGRCEGRTRRPSASVSDIGSPPRRRESGGRPHRVHPPWNYQLGLPQPTVHAV